MKKLLFLLLFSSTIFAQTTLFKNQDRVNLNNLVVASGTLQPLITGGVANFVPKFTGSNTFANSQIFDNGTGVGIGSINPTAKLEVNGQIKITGGTPSNGKVLTSDATGLATWQPIVVPTFDATIDFSVNANPNTAGTTFNPNTPASSTAIYVSTIDGSQWTYNGTTYITVPASNDWKTLGNAGTNPNFHFIGTTDNKSLNFRTNNSICQTISAAGNVGIGATTPFGRLHVALGQSDANPAAWNNNHVVFGNGSAANSSGLGIGYNSTTNEAWIATLAPGATWRPLRFHGTVWRFFTNGVTEAFTIAPNSNVGVNQTAPTNKLHVSNNGAGFNPTANDRASIKVEGSYGGGISFAEGANRAAIYSDAGSGLNFCTGGTVAGTPERMRITNIGNVGIGTTNPTSKLHVAGTTAYSFFTLTTANITLNGTQRYVNIPTGNVFTVTLPAPATCPGRVYTIANRGITPKTIGSYRDFAGNVVTDIPPATSVELINDGGTWYRMQ